MRTFLRGVFRTPAAPPAHYYSIDFGRGIAAVTILIWHYQHFFFTAGASEPSIARSAQPFYNLLEPFYSYGFYAVQYFWMISGFVFAAVYISRPGTSRAFLVNRVARLYPLQLLTLLCVAGLQLLSQEVCGHEQIYVNNDLWHFFLNLCFAAHWGLQKGLSFNGPVWSVSIEILIYAIFWFTLPFIYRFGVAGPLLFSGISWALHYHTGLLHTDQDLFRCSCYFFLGSASWIFVTQLQRRSIPLLAAAIALSSAGCWVFFHRSHSTDSLGMPLFLLGILQLFCAIEVAEQGHVFRGMRWFGDNTYGTYLWHVPIQISILIILDRFVGSRNVALHPWFFIGFIALTVCFARVSFVWIEKPARAWVQRIALPLKERHAASHGANAVSTNVP